MKEADELDPGHVLEDLAVLSGPPLGVGKHTRRHVDPGPVQVAAKKRIACPCGQLYEWVAARNSPLPVLLAPVDLPSCSTAHFDQRSIVGASGIQTNPGGAISKPFERSLPDVDGQEETHILPPVRCVRTVPSDENLEGTRGQQIVIRKPADLAGTVPHLAARDFEGVPPSLT